MDIVEQVHQRLASQNPLHAAFAQAWEQLGGIEHLVKFAEKDPATFYRLLAKMTPSMQPQHSINGDVKITVSPLMTESRLDDVVSDQ